MQATGSKPESGAGCVNREELWTLAEERVRNADALLAASQWSAAYYLAGYAVECALKAYLPAYLDRTGKIFRERDYIKKLEKCWTHGLTLLVELADLTEQLERARGANSNLKRCWSVVENWDETSRYDRKTEQDARDLYEAITQEPDGVLRWLRQLSKAGASTKDST